MYICNVCDVCVRAQALLDVCMYICNACVCVCVQALLEATERISDGWLAAGKEALAAAARVKGSVNVIVTASKLLAAVTKLKMFGLAQHIDGLHIYSCWMEGSKQQVFELFKKRHRRARFMAIGDGKAEEQASSTLKIPFHKINAQKGTKAAVRDLGAFARRVADMG